MEADDLGQDAPSTSSRDPDRFYCPFPNCNRSFAELWRLKVHYRAPPDIRGSGKERGHGTELTHCPKCGKTLKPGKHHVGCSGGKTAPRQATRRKLSDADGLGDGEDGLDCLPLAKQQRCLELPGHTAAWQDFPGHHLEAFPSALAPPGAPPGLPELGIKQEAGSFTQQPKPEVVYVQAMPHMQYWADPNQQPNGMMHAPAQYQMASGPVLVAAYPGMPLPAYPTYAAFPGYMQVAQQQPGMMAGMQVATLPPGHTLIHASGPLGGQPVQLLQMAPHHHQLQMQQPDQSTLGHGQPSTAPTSSRSVPSDPASNGTSEQYNALVEDPGTRFGRMPSPPPLPPDFHAPLTGAGTGMLFNFSQFAQKMPRTQSKLDLASASAALETPDPDMLVDHHDDGDLMQLLFGLPDELPTFATIHLHKWAPGDGSSGGSGSMTPPVRSSTPQRQLSGMQMFQGHSAQELAHMDTGTSVLTRCSLGNGGSNSSKRAAGPAAAAWTGRQGLV